MSCMGHLGASVYEYQIHVIIALVRLITRWQYGFLLVLSLHKSPMPPPTHLISFDTVTIHIEFIFYSIRGLEKI